MTQPPPASFSYQNPAPEDLLWAYRHAWFPMANPVSGELEWFSPDPRAIMPLDTFKVRPSLARVVRRGEFEITCDRSFSEVMAACAEPRGPDDETWIDERLIRCFVALYEKGHAHSIEARREGELVGGLYGVSIGGAFFGESMFTRPELGGANASKICLVHLVNWLNHIGATVLDSQYWNPHLAQFGCVEISRRKYMNMLAKAVTRDAEWGAFGEMPDG